MLIPIAVLDFELADSEASLPVVPSRFHRARVLARWDGVPVGVVDVSVRNGAVLGSDVLRALQQEFPHALAREAVRRALLRTGIAGRVDLSAVWKAPEAPSGHDLKTTVVICTRDRTADLAVCLASVMRLDPPAFEVIVVDNAPATGSTRRLISEEYPSVHYVCEHRPGLDNARNRGVAHANGDIIAFTDDDVVVDPGWLGVLAGAFAADPSLGLVTGLAEPLELETRAQILFERYGGFGRGCRRMYSQTSSGRMPWTLVGAGQLGAGANMAVRREVFARVGLFDPALDVGTPSLGGGDHDFFYRVLRAGYLCVYEPAAVVRHRHRRTMQELRRLLYSYGYATRCFLEREARAFPADRAAIRRLRHWWWRHWAWQRCRRAVFRPAWIPAELVTAEIKGFWQARGAYPGIRALMVDGEICPSDAPACTAPLVPSANGVGILVVETDTPLAPLPQAAGFAAVEIVVQWQRRPVGTVRIANCGQPISARRLADEISHALWHRLLDPSDSDVGRSFTRFGSDFAERTASARAAGTLVAACSATVVVTTCNRPDALRRCLHSLARLQTRHAVAIVVVDNRPAAGVAAAVVRDFPGVQLVNEHRAGSSYARNAGVDAAHGEFVAMVDDDMVVTPDWLDRLLAPFVRTDVMAVTGQTLPARLDTRAEQLLEVYGGFGRGFLARDFDSAWFHRWRRRAVPTWQIGGSGNLAFRREIFGRRALAGFTPLLGAGVPTGVGEDTKFFYDLLHAGHTITYEPGAVAWHHHRVSMEELRAQLYAYSKGHVAYHLMTLTEYGDGRALVRLLLELPQAFGRRALDRWRGRSPYPFRLLLTELAGTLAGPWALWRAARRARHVARAARPVHHREPGRAPLHAPKHSAVEVQL